MLGIGGQGSGFQAQGANMAQANQAQGQVQSGLSQQQQLINALNGQNGIGNQSQVFNQLQGVANGTGPNPAQAMLNQATGQNVSNQAALMAGQRGASGNVGLESRQAAMQGSGIQQNAAGQAATLQANQSLGALGQEGGIAGQQVANQMGATQNYNTLAQGNQGQLLQSLQGQNAANEGISATNANNSSQFLTGLIGGAAGSGGASSMATALAAAKGGVVSMGDITPPRGKNSRVYGDHMGQVHAMYHGGTMDMQTGGPVPGQPNVMRDSPQNDVVDAKLTPKEIVLPLSVTQAEDAPAAAAKFVADTLRKQGGGADHKKEFKEALKRAIAGRKSA
jgi:hypothetical protein